MVGVVGRDGGGSSSCAMCASVARQGARVVPLVVDGHRSGVEDSCKPEPSLGVRHHLGRHVVEFDGFGGHLVGVAVVVFGDDRDALAWRTRVRPVPALVLWTTRSTDKQAKHAQHA